MIAIFCQQRSIEPKKLPHNTDYVVVYSIYKFLRLNNVVIILEMFSYLYCIIAWGRHFGNPFFTKSTILLF